jgi:hypothetical protein
MTVPDDWVYTGAGVLVVATVTVVAAGAIGVVVATGVAGTDVAEVVAAGCTGAVDDVHPVRKTVRRRSPHTIPIRMNGRTPDRFCMVSGSIAYALNCWIIKTIAFCLLK